MSMTDSGHSPDHNETAGCPQQKSSTDRKELETVEQTRGTEDAAAVTREANGRQQGQPSLAVAYPIRWLVSNETAAARN